MRDILVKLINLLNPPAQVQTESRTVAKATNENKVRRTKK